jgi:hypothetical protein
MSRAKTTNFRPRIWNSMVAAAMRYGCGLAVLTSAGAAATGALLGSPVLGGTGASRPILALALALGAAVGAAVSVAIGGLAR